MILKVWEQMGTADTRHSPSTGAVLSVADEGPTSLLCQVTWEAGWGTPRRFCLATPWCWNGAPTLLLCQVTWEAKWAASLGHWDAWWRVECFVFAAADLPSLSVVISEGRDLTDPRFFSTTKHATTILQDRDSGTHQRVDLLERSNGHVVRTRT